MSPRWPRVWFRSTDRDVRGLWPSVPVYGGIDGRHGVGKIRRATELSTITAFPSHDGVIRKGGDAVANCGWYVAVLDEFDHLGHGFVAATDQVACGGSLDQSPRRLCGEDRVDFHVASADNSTRLGTATTGRPGRAGCQSPTMSRLVRHKYEFSDNHHSVADNTTRRPDDQTTRLTARRSTSPPTPPKGILRQPVDCFSEPFGDDASLARGVAVHGHGRHQFSFGAQIASRLCQVENEVGEVRVEGS